MAQRGYEILENRLGYAFKDRKLLENALVHGNRYATSKKVISETLEQGQDLILEIDWQGAAQVRKLHPDCVGIFILPPSLEELERRLRARGQDAEAVIQQRLSNAQAEMAHAGEFEYRIINKDFDTAKTELVEIIRRTRRAP